MAAHQDTEDTPEHSSADFPSIFSELPCSMKPSFGMGSLMECRPKGVGILVCLLGLEGERGNPFESCVILGERQAGRVALASKSMTPKCTHCS